MMRKVDIVLLTTAFFLLACFGCSKKPAPAESKDESKTAKQLLQGVWIDEETETVAFKMQGDTVYYPDTASMPAVFRVVDDTLHIGTTGYAIVKQTANVFWMKNSNGDVVRLVKSTNPDDAEAFSERKTPNVLLVTEVTKRDTVVMADGIRYHLYVAINPTKHKVMRSQMNADGLQVANAYYDNIIHVSVFQGATRLYSSNFRKQMFVGSVPGDFLSQSILSDIEFDHVDGKGFHFLANLCIPDAASCYQVATLISRKGMLTIGDEAN